MAAAVAGAGTAACDDVVDIVVDKTALKQGLLNAGGATAKAAAGVAVWTLGCKNKMDMLFANNDRMVAAIKSAKEALAEAIKYGQGSAQVKKAQAALDATSEALAKNNKALRVVQNELNLIGGLIIFANAVGTIKAFRVWSNGSSDLDEAKKDVNGIEARMRMASEWFLRQGTGELEDRVVDHFRSTANKLKGELEVLKIKVATIKEGALGQGTSSIATGIVSLATSFVFPMCTTGRVIMGIAATANTGAGALDIKLWKDCGAVQTDLRKTLATVQTCIVQGAAAAQDLPDF